MVGCLTAMRVRVGRSQVFVQKIGPVEKTPIPDSGFIFEVHCFWSKQSAVRELVETGESIAADRRSAAAYAAGHMAYWLKIEDVSAYPWDLTVVTTEAGATH
jgi:hypothetical protein